MIKKKIKKIWEGVVKNGGVKEGNRLDGLLL